MGTVDDYSDGVGLREIRSLHPAIDTVIFHKNVFPFQTIAIAKGFNNIIYTVTKAVSRSPEEYSLTILRND